MLLITGATGFVGRALTDRLRAEGRTFRRALRNSQGADETSTIVGPVGADTHWEMAVSGCSAVVHLAARVHVMREAATQPLSAFREVNVEGTRTLALQAARAGVRRFVFLSSVKVNGEATAGRAFEEVDPPNPQDPYGISKREAEDVLRRIARETGLEVVILRPPLVYGPGVKANFLRMMRWIDRGVPLPLGSVRNARSLVYVGNLVDAVIRCVEHPAAAGETFLVDDGEPVSTPQLLREIGAALGRPARLFPIPPALLKAAAILVGRGEDAARLLGDLVVDDARLRRVLDWRPPYTRSEGLAQTVDWIRAVSRG